MIPPGATRHFIYYGYADAGQIDRIAKCVLPGGDAATLEVGRILDLNLRSLVRAADGRRLSISSGSASATLRRDGEAVALAPVIVNDCQYGGTHPDCWGRPDSGVPDSGGGDGDPYGGDGGGGWVTSLTRMPRPPALMKNSGSR